MRQLLTYATRSSPLQDTVTGVVKSSGIDLDAVKATTVTVAKTASEGANAASPFIVKFWQVRCGSIASALTVGVATLTERSVPWLSAVCSCAAGLQPNGKRIPFAPNKPTLPP